MFSALAFYALNCNVTCCLGIPSAGLCLGRVLLIRLKVFEREVHCNIFFGHKSLAGQGKIVYTISFYLHFKLVLN
ncbi:hypothetical protein KC19_2G153400 [Ceratodon purpureus]|uniref:Secreted protein n=1 Tax=Ceratodon purpureus TaxID=3225 RepID=A0A8T0IU65_CERPU|nr:hypothetical protein KC19_2G153400 [Ceratodon purpureus]